MSEVQNVERLSQESGVSREQPTTAPTEQKRKYRRHPKPDENAPEKPPSAYVLFSNKIREEVKSENLSFTDIARLVGERWQKLDPAQKDRFESHASALKETYNAQLGEYKKTDEYREYSQYLAEFKAKHSHTNEPKRPKLESYQSSSVSVPSPGVGEGVTQFAGHGHRPSIGSSGTVPFSGQVAALAATQTQGVALPHLNTPVMRRASPPYLTSQESRRLGHVSSHSSMSEESSSTRAEQSDALSRTASLSITATSIEPLPPLIIPGHRTGWPEYTQPPAYGATPARRPPQPYGQSATSGTSPASTTTSIAASSAGADWWRDRGQEATRPTLGAGTTPGSMAISKLVASSQSEEPVSASIATRRALPLPRHVPGIATQSPYSGMGVLTSPTHTHHPPPELTPIRERQSQEGASRSESEAADVLAGLSERRSGAYQPWTPRTRPDDR